MKYVSYYVIQSSCMFYILVLQIIENLVCGSAGPSSGGGGEVTGSQSSNLLQMLLRLNMDSWFNPSKQIIKPRQQTLQLICAEQLYKWNLPFRVSGNQL